MRRLRPEEVLAAVLEAMRAGDEFHREGAKSEGGTDDSAPGGPRFTEDMIAESSVS
jgi:hypothetical protein